MTAKEFDELIARLASAASRRNAVRGIAGGAIASVGAAPFAAAKSKGKGKRVLCFCPNSDPDNCRTRRAKTKKFKKLMRKHRNSHRGPCETSTTTTASPPTSSEPPTSQEPTSPFPGSSPEF